jgi:hypothetical protein
MQSTESQLMFRKNILPLSSKTVEMEIFSSKILADF